MIINETTEKRPMSKPTKSTKLHPQTVELKSKKKRKTDDVYGMDDMSDGPLPPTPPHAVKSPRTPINHNDETNQ